MAKSKVALATKLLKGKVSKPDLAEIAAEFFRVAGGTRAVAKKLYEEFNKAQPGSLARAKILDLVIWMTKITTDGERKLEDINLLSEADLERRITQLIEKQQQKDEADGLQPERPDAEAETSSGARGTEDAGLQGGGEGAAGGTAGAGDHAGDGGSAGAGVPVHP